MAIEWTRAIKRRIERDLEQGCKFLHAMSCLVDVRLSMEAYGYTHQVHLQGQQLFCELLFCRQPWEVGTLSRPQLEALAELSRWADEKLGLIRSTLETRHPGPAKFIFSSYVDLGKHPPYAILAFLDRCQSLRNGTARGREASREADRAAVELLEARNLLNDELEARLRALVAQAQEIARLEIPEGMEIEDGAYLEKADRFHVWLKDWRTTTRTAIENRRHLSRLGLTSYHRKQRAYGAGHPNQGNS